MLELSIARQQQRETFYEVSSIGRHLFCVSSKCRGEVLYVSLASSHQGPEGHDEMNLAGASEGDNGTTTFRRRWAYRRASRERTPGALRSCRKRFFYVCVCPVYVDLCGQFVSIDRL